MGFAIIVIFGGLISSLITLYIELKWIKIGAAIIFIGLGLFQMIALVKIKEKDKHEQQDEISPVGSTDIVNNFCEDRAGVSKKKKSAFFTGFVAILAMEMGDKTQIMTIMLAASSESMPAVLIGSWIALSSLALFGAFFGKWLSEKVPKKIMDWVASFLFLFIGLVLLIQQLII
ncbi:MAG: hypothetical protein GF364_21970 [Candidatus Lokiarchaeota archaeon]|nr:hypothetical protein [Candidatus Lokiarchaeota archaeon]